MALLAPFFLEAFWLQTGLFAMAAAIGAIGLTILTGTAGQLSLAHAFFAAVGAYGYCYLAGGGGLGVSAASGLGLPTLPALVLAVAIAGLAGALYSPIAGRLRGIYLGIASIGLVFIGQHILFNATGLTGGFNGRDAAPFSLVGFSFGAGDPELVILGVPFEDMERLWYLGLVLLAIAYLFGRLLVAGRPGRALETIRDSEVAAAVNGVDVTRYKAAAFTISSMYAGLAGVLLALVFGRIVPESFGLNLSVEFLAMIVIGGLGSIRGAVLGGDLRLDAAEGARRVLGLAAVPGGRRLGRRHRARHGRPLRLRRGDRRRPRSSPPAGSAPCGAGRAPPPSTSPPKESAA